MLELKIKDLVDDFDLTVEEYVTKNLYDWGLHNSIYNMYLTDNSKEAPFVKEYKMTKKDANGVKIPTRNEVQILPARTVKTLYGNPFHENRGEEFEKLFQELRKTQFYFIRVQKDLGYKIEEYYPNVVFEFSPVGLENAIEFAKEISRGKGFKTK